MANIPINDISLNDIHVAVGGTHQTEVSLNDTDIRNATGLTLNATYSDLHGTGIDATDASTISIHEFRNAEYGVVYSSYALTPESVIKNETNDRQQTFSFIENNSGGAKTFIWRIVSGGSDFTASSGSFSTVFSGAPFNISSQSFTVEVVEDNTTEGTESFTLEVALSTDTGYSNVLDTATIEVTDTSLTPASATYAGSFDVASIDEDGSSAATFTVTTANVSNGATVGYTITGVSVSDISLPSLTGTITINSNTGSVSFTANADATTEGAETVTLTLASTDSNSTATGSVSDTVVINDTSLTASDPVTSTMDVYPLHSTNPYTVSMSSIVSTGDTTAASRCEGYLMVEESGSDIIVYAAGAGTVLTGAGNSSTVSILYKSEGTTNTSTMTAIPETGTDYSNRRECFRLNDIASAGWTVKYSLSEQVTWETSPTGRAITFVANHSTVDDNFDGITTSAQGVTSGSKGKRALWFGLTALSGTNEAEINQQNDGSVRLTFSKSGETDRVVDTQWSLQATALSDIEGGGFGGGGL